MAKLINADETVKAIIKRLGIGNERYLLPSERAIVDVIECMPTVNDVAVVLCKDCKHYDDKHEVCCVYLSYRLAKNEDDFCSDAERKEE